VAIGKQDIRLSLGKLFQERTQYEPGINTDPAPFGTAGLQGENIRQDAQ
jgi:hypothetical protein